MRHVRGSGGTQDECIFEEKDEKYRVHIGLERSEQYLTMGSYASITSEQRVLNLADQSKGWQVVAER